MSKERIVIVPIVCCSCEKDFGFCKITTDNDAEFTKIKSITRNAVVEYIRMELLCESCGKELKRNEQGSDIPSGRD